MYINKIDDNKFSVVDGAGCCVGHLTKSIIHDAIQWGFNAISGFEPPLEQMPFIVEQLKILNEAQVC